VFVEITILAISIPLANGQFSRALGQFRVAEIWSRTFSRVLEGIRFSPNAFCHHFSQIQYFDVVTFRVICGIANHDGAIRARNNHGRRARRRKLRESKLVHASFVLAAGIVRDKQLRAACSATLRVRTMMRRFRDCDSRSAKNLARLLGDPASASQITRVMIGGCSGGRFNRKPRQQLRD
jgi:hypothetical protein